MMSGEMWSRGPLSILYLYYDSGKDIFTIERMYLEDLNRMLSYLEVPKVWSNNVSSNKSVRRISEAFLRTFVL